MLRLDKQHALSRRREHAPFLVLDLGLNIVDSVRGLDLKSDSLAGEGLDKDLHAVEASARCSNDAKRALGSPRNR